METKPFTWTYPVFALFVILCKQTTLQDKGIRRNSFAFTFCALFYQSVSKNCKTLKTSNWSVFHFISIGFACGRDFSIWFSVCSRLWHRACNVSVVFTFQTPAGISTFLITRPSVPISLMNSLIHTFIKSPGVRARLWLRASYLYVSVG